MLCYVMFDVINNAIDPNRGDALKNPSHVLQQNLYAVNCL